MNHIILLEVQSCLYGLSGFCAEIMTISILLEYIDEPFYSLLQTCSAKNNDVSISKLKVVDDKKLTLPALSGARLD